MESKKNVKLIETEYKRDWQRLGGWGQRERLVKGTNSALGKRSEDLMCHMVTTVVNTVLYK